MKITGLVPNVLFAALVVISLLFLASLIYAIFSRRFTDKIVASNMIGTLTINAVVILAVLLEEDYILDIGIVYALLSFLGVMVLCRVVTDHIFGRLRHLKDSKGELSREEKAAAGRQDSRFHGKRGGKKK